MATRITDRPAKVFMKTTESAANTYTESSLTLPVVAVSRNRVQAIELMKVDFFVPAPDHEAGQANTVDYQLVRDTQSAIINFDPGNEDQLIHKDASSLRDLQSAAGQTSNLFLDSRISIDFTTEKKGLILIDRKIYMGIAGTGNANAKTVRAQLWYHLVVLEPSEVLVNLFLEDEGSS